MTKKLILHIGTEKTGTTAVQEFLALNRKEFFEQGFFIPESPSSSAPNHRKLATACFNENRKDDSFRHFNIKDLSTWQSNTLDTIRAELEAEDTATHVISSEHFSSRLITPSEKQRLYDFLSPIYDEIKVIAYFRRQDQYAVSLYSTYLKSGGTEKGILPNSANINRYGYFEMCRDWERVFGSGSVQAKVFDRSELLSGNIVNDFASVVGVDIAGFKPVPADVNPSLTPFGQEILRSANFLLKKGLISSHQHNQFVSYLEVNYAGSPRLPKRSYVQDWYAQYEESNKKFFDIYCHSSEGFSDDFSKYPDDWAKGNFENHDVLEEIFKYFVKSDFDK